MDTQDIILAIVRSDFRHSCIKLAQGFPEIPSSEGYLGFVEISGTDRVERCQVLCMTQEWADDYLLLGRVTFQAERSTSNHPGKHFGHVTTGSIRGRWVGHLTNHRLEIGELQLPNENMGRHIINAIQL